MRSSQTIARRGSLLSVLGLVLLVAACAAPQVTRPPAPTGTATPARAAATRPTPTPLTPPTTAPTALPTVTLAMPTPPTTTPSPPPSPTRADVTLLEERSIGAYTIRLWQPLPGTGMYNHATLSAAGQPEIQIEAVSAIASLPADDVTGDGFPDVAFETYAGGSHCCWGTVAYSLGPVAEKVLDLRSAPYNPGTGSGTFHDLDGDGTYEFLTRDPLGEIPCTGPSVKVVLQAVPGQGYVGASPRFASAYADDLAAHTRRAEEEIELSRDGYKCGVYELIVDLLYTGQPERAWQELERLYLGPDRDAFRAQLEQAVRQGRFFVPAATPQPLPAGFGNPAGAIESAPAPAT